MEILIYSYTNSSNYSILNFTFINKCHSMAKKSRHHEYEPNETTRHVIECWVQPCP